MAQFSNVSSKYGAPMGRRECADNPNATVSLFRVNMVDGDYDDGGAYWGGGQPLYCARDDEGDFRQFVRADSLESAKAQLLASFPNITIRPDTLTKMVGAYLECALWTETDDDDQPLDASYQAIDFSAEAVEQARTDCEAFLAEAGQLPDFRQAGHDFWLSRNGHGSGFWARPEIWGEEGADILTALSESFGSTHPYVGDDGMLYFA